MFKLVGAAGEPAAWGCKEPAAQALWRPQEQPPALGCSTDLFVGCSAVSDQGSPREAGPGAHTQVGRGPPWLLSLFLVRSCAVAVAFEDGWGGDWR